MFQHIMVPLDGSPLAEQALPVAARIARFTGGTLLLVQVVPLEYTVGLSPIPLVSQQTIDEEIGSATAYLQTLVTSLALADIEIRTEVVFGLPVQQLLAFAKTAGTDLIVLSSHGRTDFMRWMIGSVAHALVHQCKLPILVLRRDGILSSHTSAGPLHVLVPLDGSPLAEAVLRPAAYVTAALAATGQGTLHLSQVVKVSSTHAEEEFGSALNNEALQHASTYLSQAEEGLSSEGRDLHLSFSHSVELAHDVASTLLTLAEHGKVGKTREDTGESDQFDLIAISTHGHGGLERWVMGSVTDRLLNTTKLPMLIVRPSKEA